MCAINGVTKEDEALVVRMNELTQHRGPDGSRVWVGNGVTFGHNRLAIIDLSTRALQPMQSRDGRYTIVFNGEIYNYRELRSELASVYTFVTESDTEVLLAAYIRWGNDMLGRLRGIFAFGIWDRETETLVLARDQVGVKPLYYSVRNGVLHFSSELKSLIPPGTAPRLNMDAFSKYMCVLYTPGRETLMQGIEKLLPGHLLTWKHGKSTIQRYYSAPQAADHMGMTREAYWEHIRQTVDTSVERQLISDVPVGVYLSGGIDSTIVTDAMSRGGGKVETFSIGFDLGEGEQSKKFNADMYLARKTAHAYGTTHHECMLRSTDVRDLLESHVWHMDEPVGNMTALAQYALAAFARKHVTVALGGDGGDELFGGYTRHILGRRLLPYWKLPEGIRSFAPAKLRRANVRGWANRYALFLSQKDALLERLTPYARQASIEAFFREEYFGATTEDSFLDDMMHADLSSWLVDESLLRSDKMSMAHGLEQRVPLLDIDLIALARSIPAQEKITFFETKKIFRDAFRTRLPAHVFDQPKRGWISPGAKWLRRPEMVTYLKEVLSSEYHAGTKDLFDWKQIEAMYQSHREHTGYYLAPLWSVVVFQIWAKKFNVEASQVL